LTPPDDRTNCSARAASGPARPRGLGRSPSPDAASGRVTGTAEDNKRSSELTHGDTTVPAPARHLGVDWHTAWNAMELEAKARICDPIQFNGAKALGVDEHILAAKQGRGDRAVTILVDLWRDQARMPPRLRSFARSLDGVAGRSGSGYKAWVKPTGGVHTSITRRGIRSVAMPTRFMMASLKRW
jgi:hypothetical protein